MSSVPSGSYFSSISCDLPSTTRRASTHLSLPLLVPSAMYSSSTQIKRKLDPSSTSHSTSIDPLRFKKPKLTPLPSEHQRLLLSFVPPSSAIYFSQLNTIHLHPNPSLPFHLSPQLSSPSNSTPLPPPSSLSHSRTNHDSSPPPPTHLLRPPSRFNHPRSRILQVRSGRDGGASRWIGDWGV